MISIDKFKGAESVFRFFTEISKIPRASGNTRGIADYLMNFAAERGLEAIRDDADNVVIRKSATPGRENSPAVIFQGHTDMVAAWEAGSDFDFNKDALDLYVDGDFLRARGTTIGGDDGVAVAYALAVLDSSDISHPDFEAVFTSDEETGLIGAKAISPDIIRGRLLINIDSDAEGIFTAGCAGGLRCDITRSLETACVEGDICSVAISSLRGGHSGVEIDKGRINAIKQLGKALSELGSISLVSLQCGNADNAIPRDAAVTFVSEKPVAELLDAVAKQTKAELISLGEVDACVDYSVTRGSHEALSVENSREIIALINELDSGVLAMSEDIEGLVETSQNLGIATLYDGKLTLTVSVRSAKGEKKRLAADKIQTTARAHGADVREHSDYPAWEYKKESVLREVMCRVYREMYGKDAEVVIIHAGLECGIFSDKIPELDCVSIGPDNYDIHTPEERLSIPSTVRVWEYLIKVLEEI